MIDWIEGAPPAELAEELMTIFGPDGPNVALGPDVTQFRDWHVPHLPQATRRRVSNQDR